MVRSMEQFILTVTDPLLNFNIETVMEMWPHITSTIDTIWACVTSTQIITAGVNILVLVPIATVLVIFMGYFAAGRKVLVTSCYFFVFAAAVDWINSWGYCYYHLLGFSFTLALLAANDVYIVDGDISNEIVWIYQVLDYIGLDDGMVQYSSNRLENRQQIRRARKYRQRPVPPAPSPEEVAEKAAQFRRLQDRCERARILAYPLIPVVEAALEGVENNNVGAAVGVVAWVPPVNTNSLAEPDYQPENTEGHTPRQVDLDKRSGRYLSQWLAREIHEGEGFVVPVKWSQCKKTGEIACYNGYTQANRPVPQDFFASSDALVIGSVSVLQPTEIRSALRLINTALDYIRFYDTTAFDIGGRENLQSHSQFRRAVAVNCEFKRYPAEFRHDSAMNFDVDNPHWNNQEGPGKHQKHKKYVEKDRELVSLLTVSVDRYLVVTFHIAYMLQHPTAETSRELAILFEELILDKRVIKILHNVPDSIAALDATLEHIFRGRRPTGRGIGYAAALRRYNSSARKSFRDRANGPLRTPHYKDTGPDTFLDVNRPTATEFRRGERACPLGLHGPGVDYAGRHCPCYLGILDITSVLDLILRQHHFIPGDPAITPNRAEVLWPALASWAEPREDCKFERLAQWMLAGSKYQPLLCRFKARSPTKPQLPDVTGLEEASAAEVVNVYNMRSAIYKEKVAQLYTAFGETKGVETDDECLSYIVGDAIGLGLIFRYLLTVESARLTAERLCHYGYREIFKTEPFAYETALYRPPLAPLSLPPFVVPDAHTIGLEVDVRPEQDVRDYLVDAIYEELAGRPWWYMRRDTHWRAVEQYGRVISNRFDRTGWQYPVPLEAVPPNVPIDRNNNQPVCYRNLAAQIFRNNAANMPQNLLTMLARATHFSNGTWFWAFARLLEWHCGLVSLMLPAEELAIIYNDARPVPAEVAFRREFEALVRTTGTRVVLRPRAARIEQLTPPPEPARLPETPPVLQAPTGQSPTPSPPHQPRWGLFGWRAGPNVPLNPAPRDLAPRDLAPGGWSWRNLWGLRRDPQPVEAPQTENNQPPEGYVVRRSNTTGRLFWYNRERGDSIWPDTAAALASERRAVDATAAAAQAVAAANEQVARAADASTAAETSAREAAIHAATAQQQNSPAGVLQTTNSALATRAAADAAAQRLRNARDAFTRINQYAEYTATSLRTGRADAAVDAARQANDTVAAVRLAAEAAIQYADEATAAAQRAFGAAAPAFTAIRVASRQAADRDTAALNDFPATQALYDQFLIRQNDIVIIPPPGVEAADFVPPAVTASLNNVLQILDLARGAQVLSTDAITRATAVAADVNSTQEQIDGAVATQTTTRQAAVTAQEALDGIARSAGITYLAVQNVTTVADQPDPAAILASDALERALETAARYPEQLATVTETARVSLAAADAAQLRSTQADAAAAALGLEPEPEPEPEPVADADADALALISVPIPEQHDFVDGVCAEILIFMLVQEISQYEALDDERRRFLGFTEMEDEYSAFSRASLWDHPTVKSMTEQAGLGDGRLSYAEPYWFKRLQVLLGHDFACCVPLNSPDTTICQECGARDRYELLEMLIAELEKIRKLADVQTRLKDAYRRIYRETRQKMWIRTQLRKPRAPSPVPTYLVETVPDAGLVGFLWTPVQDFLGGVLGLIGTVLALLWPPVQGALGEILGPIAAGFADMWTPAADIPAAVLAQIGTAIAAVLALIGTFVAVLWVPFRAASTLRALWYRSYLVVMLTLVNMVAPRARVALVSPTRPPIPAPAFAVDWTRTFLVGLWIIPQASCGAYILYYGIGDLPPPETILYYDTGRLFQPGTILAGLWTPIINAIALWLSIPPLLIPIQELYPNESTQVEIFFTNLWPVILEVLREPALAPVVVPPVIVPPVVVPPVVVPPVVVPPVVALPEVVPAVVPPAVVPPVAVPPVVVLPVVALPEIVPAVVPPAVVPPVVVPPVVVPPVVALPVVVPPVVALPEVVPAVVPPAVVPPVAVRPTVLPPAVVAAQPEVIPPIPTRTQHENEWIMPPWCRCLLKTPLNVDMRYPRPSARRLHRDWLQATILLLHLNPRTGAETWNCLTKWWQQGLRVQAVCFADENVQQFDFPSMTQVTAENPQPMPNFGINLEAVAARRVYGSQMRQRVAVAHQSDHELALAAARLRAAERRDGLRPPLPPPPLLPQPLPVPVPVPVPVPAPLPVVPPVPLPLVPPVPLLLDPPLPVPVPVPVPVAPLPQVLPVAPPPQTPPGQILMGG